VSSSSDADIEELFSGEILKQRDDGATLIKVYVSPDEHILLKQLCNSRGGMSHVLRQIAVQWANEQNDRS
jgi:hypothetical protein